MKKYILPVIGLALLTGCGKVSDSNVDDKPINIVSGTVEASSRENDTYESEAASDSKKSSHTTTKLAGEKVSGTTTDKTKKSNVQPATRANGGSDGVVHGTTRAVPVAPRNNNTNPTTAEPTQEQTQAPSFDTKNCDSISLSFDEKTPNKIGISREYSDGKVREYQHLSVDTTYIQEQLEKDPSKKITDFFKKVDLDGDTLPDLCIYEKEDGLNMVCRYYRYDPETGVYSSWNELNALKYEVSVDANNGMLEVCFKRDDKIEYETKSYEWNAQKQLVLRSFVHQYTNDENVVLIEYIDYDENGIESSRRVEDSSGQRIEPSDPDTPHEEE
ncbi:MAG: hypothetical protein K6G33_06025 [Ruminococcus sp.]|uniref:hypothetical protein n=1 Tax=Ruminococcus sp. TaxID=41978 RepID=UPI0025E01B71|nr:hypothetical protein [Ruminococcus sp.]MCR5600280.1 hypothetical protein [Ruminococcus sp.]